MALVNAFDRRFTKRFIAFGMITFFVDAAALLIVKRIGLDFFFVAGGCLVGMTTSAWLVFLAYHVIDCQERIDHIRSITRHSLPPIERFSVEPFD